MKLLIINYKDLKLEIPLDRHEALAWIRQNAQAFQRFCVDMTLRKYGKLDEIAYRSIVNEIIQTIQSARQNENPKTYRWESSELYQTIMKDFEKFKVEKAATSIQFMKDLEKFRVEKAATSIQFWYKRTRDENKVLSLIEDQQNSSLARSIMSRR